MTKQRRAPKQRKAVAVEEKWDGAGQIDAVQAAYDALHNVYFYSTVPAITKEQVIKVALDKIARAFPNNETPFR